MPINCALAGNPNSGKTTLFNLLTGSTAHVGNWPGVTVERKEGRYKKAGEIIHVIDLPGIYSMSPYTPEEIVSRDYILDHGPDVVINIVDATNLQRNLYLTTQLMESDIPIVVALNMMDVVEKEGTRIDTVALERSLGVPVCSISASRGQGVQELMDHVSKAAATPRKAFSVLFDSRVSSAVKQMNALLSNTGGNALFYAVKLLENDDRTSERLALSTPIRAEVDKICTQAKQTAGTDLEAAIADARYQFITKHCANVVTRASIQSVPSGSANIDRILTNRILGIPIFLLIMLFVFQLTFGATLFTIPMPGVLLQSWMERLIEAVTGGIAVLLKVLGASNWALGLVVDGILGGIGAVLSFLPQILLLFLFLSILEGSGYMARAAFIMDRLLRRLGLSGKSFVPMLMGFGCSVPALMASRTLENEKDRRLTMMLTPFMSCGAKFPIYGLFAAALFEHNQALVLLCIYLLGIVVAVLSGIILNKTVMKGEAAPFIMELPAYRFPTLKSLWLDLWEKGKHFLTKVGTVLTLVMIAIWFLQHFDFSLHMVEDVNTQSMLAQVGGFIAPLFAPLGFGNGKAAVAILVGFLAKEAVVSVMGFLYGGSSADILDMGTSNSQFNYTLTALAAVLSPPAAFSYMAFNLLAPPCCAALSTLAREMNSVKWTVFTIAFQLAVAYTISLLIFQIGSLLI